MTNYSNVLSDNNLFSSFIVSCVPDVNLQELKQEAYEIQKSYEGKQKSNSGGYQSPVFDKKCEFKTFELLKEITIQFSSDIVRDLELNLPIPEYSWWMNINKNCDYNILHNHGRADLIGVYYISAPENSGDLVLLRNDGSAYMNLYKNRNKDLKFFVPAEIGRLYIFPGHLWHYVHTNQSQENRISVSFNIYFD